MIDSSCERKQAGQTPTLQIVLRLKSVLPRLADDPHKIRVAQLETALLVYVLAQHCRLLLAQEPLENTEVRNILTLREV